LQQEHVARLRRVGQGTEFESLRAYVSGDPFSHIDWKATARRDALYVRNYQPDTKQSITIAIDVGHATASEYEGLSQLDHFVNAALMFAYAAQRQGDWISLLAFSDRIESYLPPVQGPRMVEQVARTLYGLQPRLVGSDYSLACRYLEMRNRKRGLICMMTDVIDSDASEAIISNMARFARRHRRPPAAASVPRRAIAGGGWRT
jgi:uncharacterized protein (DUF58 family)